MSQKVIVHSNPLPGRDEEFNRWYDQHVLELLRIPGFRSAERLKIVDGFDAPARYVGIYEVDDAAAALKNYAEQVQKGAITPTDTLDEQSVLISAYAALSH